RMSQSTPLNSFFITISPRDRATLAGAAGRHSGGSHVSAGRRRDPGRRSRRATPRSAAATPPPLRRCGGAPLSPPLRPSGAGAHAMTAAPPALFVGDGSPMNALEDNTFTQTWRRLGAELPPPRAILCVSAHWETNGTAVGANARPETIHDFYGF